MINNEALKLKLLCGTILYNELTDRKTKAIDKAQAKALTDAEMDAIFCYLQSNELNYEYDLIATESFFVIMDELNEREPIDFDPKKDYEEFKEKYSEFFRE